MDDAILAPQAQAMQPATSTRATVALLVVASLAFATSSPLARAAVGIPPVAVACGRTAIAAVAIFLFMPGRTLAAVRALGGRARLALVGAGLLLALHFALFLEGLATTSFPAAVALVSLEPLSVVLVAWAVFGLAPARREGIGILLATAGALVVSTGAGHGEHRLLGDALVVLAVVVFGGYVAAARGLRKAMPGLPYAAGVYGVASVALVPFAVVFWPAASAPQPAAGSWVAVVLLGLVPTLVGHTLLQLASRRISPSLVALVSPGETVGSLAIGAVALHAWPSGHEAIGAALVLAGATIAILRRG